MANKNERLTVSIDTGTMLRWVGIVVSAFLVLSFIKAVSTALIILFIAFFLALALNPAVSWIAKRLKSRSRIRATAAAYLVVLAVLTGFFSLIIPPLVQQTADFVRDVPRTIQEFQASDTAFSRFVDDYDLEEQLDRLGSDFASRFSDVGEPVLTTAGAVGTVVASAIAVLVLTFMMLVEGPAWFDKIMAAQPKSKRSQRTKLAKRMYRTVTGYVNGQLILAVMAGAFALIALVIASSIFDANINEIALAGIITLFALLPLIGTTLGAVIVTLTCLLVSTPLAITMAIYFIVYQQIENVTIQPYIQARSSKLTPLIVFTAALIGVNFAGILGALVAIPVAGSIKILLEDRYRTRLAKASKS